MSEPQQGRYDSIARRWLALVELRQAHFIELCDSGRWRHYYTHDEFLAEMQKVLRVRDQWAELAGLSNEDSADAADAPAPELEVDTPPLHALSAAVPAPSWPD
jgi:uncharacterized repeat protein (TIGR03809 family)